MYQKNAWEAFKKIPYGETCSYSDMAKAIGRLLAFHAIARTNGTNQLALVIPCHCVINASGDLGVYGGGLTRK